MNVNIKISWNLKYIREKLLLWIIKRASVRRTILINFYTLSSEFFIKCLHFNSTRSCSTPFYLLSLFLIFLSSFWNRKKINKYVRVQWELLVESFLDCLLCLLFVDGIEKQQRQFLYM